MDMISKLFRLSNEDLKNLETIRAGLGCKTAVEAVRISLKQSAKKFGD